MFYRCEIATTNQKYTKFNLTNKAIERRLWQNENRTIAYG